MLHSPSYLAYQMCNNGIFYFMNNFYLLEVLLILCNIYEPLRDLEVQNLC